MSLAGGLSAGSYLRGSIAFVVVLVALMVGAYRLRNALLPGWSGAEARLAEIVIALTGALLAAQLLGSVHAFAPVPVFVTITALGIALAFVPAVWRTTATSAPARPRPLEEPRAELAVAVLAVSALVAQWCAHVADTLGRGMTHPDTLWYHSPFSTRFIQERSFTGLGHLGYPSTRYFPFDSELVHALVTLPFRRDVLSPFVNLGWAALAILAAWAVGHRRGVGALSVVGAVAVIALPAITGTQPGQASNDLQCAALLLVAVALLLRDDSSPTVVVLAGAAAGMALSTRLVAAAPLVALTVGLMVIAWRNRRPVAAIAWCAGLALTGSYWFVRNSVGAGSPLPYFDIGPLHARVPPEGDSLWAHLTDGNYWRKVYWPGLPRGLGRAWPVVLGLVVLFVVLVFWQRRAVIERALGAAVGVGAVAYVFTPLTGGITFPFNLRYLAPVLLLAFTLLPLSVGARSRAGWRVGLLVALALLVVVNMSSTNHERVDAWPSGSVGLGLLAGAVFLAAVFVLYRFGMPAPRVSIAGATVLMAGTIALGWPVQQHYLQHRYLDAGLYLDHANALFRGVHDSRVAVFGAVEVYPMFGLDLSNEVANDDIANDDSRDACARWRDVRAGAYRYVVFTSFGVLYPKAPPRRWFIDDRAARELSHDGMTYVYEVTGALHPAECA